jgi:UDP-glucose 4-epimerase
MSRILVTGGAGFVGRNLINRLLLDGHVVTSVDDYSNGVVSEIVLGAEHIKLDVSRVSEWKALSNLNFDVVFHLAAQSSNALSFRNPVRDMEVNQIATLNVLNFCKQNNVPRLIFTSSMSIYGNPAVFPTPEFEPANPETFYAVHKLASENYLKLSKNINWTIFRLYTTYGFGQNLVNREQGLVKILLGFVMRQEPLRVHGSLNRIRDIVHISDVVDALTTAINREKTFGKVYNVGSGRTVFVGEIIQQILEVAGKPTDYPIILERPDNGDPIKTHANISSITNDLGWIPRIMPDEGIRKTIETYKSQGEFNSSE